VLSVPIAWVIMQYWLQNFAYRINITPYVFLMTGGITLVVVLFTISWQTIKAAQMNPVESIRTE
ncbi:MAG: hypothetical protein PVH63_09695, partial [Balneolaceae bacterium]